MVDFVACNRGLSVFSFAKEVVDTATFRVVVSVVDAEIAEYFFLALLQTDLWVPDYQVEGIISHRPLPLEKWEDFLLGKWKDDALTISHLVGVEGAFWVCPEEQTRFCFDDEDNVGDGVDVLVEGGGVERVHFEDEGGSENTPLLQFFNLIFDE